jgi:hypothetical protein
MGERGGPVGDLAFPPVDSEDFDAHGLARHLIADVARSESRDCNSQTVRESNVTS